jgi:hypothetical protein
MWYFISLSLQNVLHKSPLAVGGAMVPFAAALAVCARIAPRPAARFGARPVVAAGCLLAAAGFGPLGSGWPGLGWPGLGWPGLGWPGLGWPGLGWPGLGWQSGYLGALLGPGLAISAGTGLVIAPLVTAVAAAGPAAAGVVSGMINAARQVGGSLGQSVLTAIAVAPAAGSASGYSWAFAAAAVISVITAATVLTLPPDSTTRTGDSHA